MSEAVLDDMLLFFWLSAVLLASFLVLLTTTPPLLLSGLLWMLLLLMLQLLSDFTDMLRLLRPLRNVPLGVKHRVGRVLSFFSSRRNWDSPNPTPACECAPPPFGSWGRGTLADERGGERVPIPTRGHTLWYSIYTYTCMQGCESRRQTFSSTSRPGFREI